MKSLQELNAIKERILAQGTNRQESDESVIRVVVGMATCGIAAGARPVLSAFMDEVSNRGLKNVVVGQTGCIGMCAYEPIVEVFVPGKEKVTYVRVNPDKVPRIITEHIVNGKPVDEFMKLN